YKKQQTLLKQPMQIQEHLIGLQSS
ncbi:hypothetical protein EVA_05084, partial [gut metagenome]